MSSLPSQTASISGVNNSDEPVTVFHGAAQRHRSTQSSRLSSLAKVFHLINGEHYSGAERVQDLLSSALPSCGYQVDFGCIKPDRFEKSIKNRQASVASFAMSHKYDFSVVGPIVDHVRQSGHRLIHAHTPRTLMIGRIVAKRTGLPLVYHVHSPVGRDSTRRFSNWINTQVESWMLKRAAAMICVSENIYDYMIGLGHDAERLFMVANGVEAIHDLPSRVEPSEPWTIGTVALFRPRKGTEVLLQALADLKQRAVNVRVLAVGPFESPEYERQIHALADQLGVAEQIEWTGFTENVNTHFRSMDAFVLPSLFGEGLPMVILEAMANGIPVVATDVEGIRQAIQHETDGLICQPGNAAKLADAIESLVSGQFAWGDIRDRAIERQRLHFSDASMARGVADVYDEILNSR